MAVAASPRHRGLKTSRGLLFQNMIWYDVWQIDCSVAGSYVNVPNNYSYSGSGMFNPDSTFFHPGTQDPRSELFPSQIPDPQRIQVF
jgi:hypothetical protein